MLGLNLIHVNKGGPWSHGLHLSLFAYKTQSLAVMMPCDIIKLQCHAWLQLMAWRFFGAQQIADLVMIYYLLTSWGPMHIISHYLPDVVNHPRNAKEHTHFRIILCITISPANERRRYIGCKHKIIPAIWINTEGIFFNECNRKCCFQNKKSFISGLNELMEYIYYENIGSAAKPLIVLSDR